MPILPAPLTWWVPGPLVSKATLSKPLPKGHGPVSPRAQTCSGIGLVSEEDSWEAELA